MSFFDILFFVVTVTIFIGLTVRCYIGDKRHSSRLKICLKDKNILMLGTVEDESINYSLGNVSTISLENIEKIEKYIEIQMAKLRSYRFVCMHIIHIMCCSQN